jgi:Apea-like HEPN
MSFDHLRQPLKELTQLGLEAIAQSSFGIDGCAKAIAYYSPSKDELITKQENFALAVDAISQLQEVKDLYGSAESPRLALQFVYKACSYVAAQHSHSKAFEYALAAFAEEMTKPNWAFKSVANMQNIECSEYPMTIGPGVSVRGRIYKELAPLLGWGDFELNMLSSDWETCGGASPFVVVVERDIKKTPSNFLVSNDGSEYSIISRMLMAMRLVAPGDVRTGPILNARPSTFNVGIGGVNSSRGFVGWTPPGQVYKLTQSLLPQIQRTYQDLVALESQAEKSNSTLRLALRSFSSIYDRFYHQAEDRVVDAITCLEALWQLDGELSFRLAFRTASLLALTEDERLEILDTLRKYYEIRSKVVHGGSLKAKDNKHLNEDEPLRNIVRRMLNAFLHLATHPASWTLDKAIKEADRTLLHADKRKELQAAMGIGE